MVSIQMDSIKMSWRWTLIFGKTEAFFLTREILNDTLSNCIVLSLSIELKLNSIDSK
jgi:hypothetical protein